MDYINLDYVIDVSRATMNIQNIIMQILYHFGILGNSIFFICSAWFLLDSHTYKKRKWFFMLAEIWSVSIFILIVTYIILNGNVSFKIIIKSFFPTIFGNNWYMTCYLLFYPIHPVLNNIINCINKKQLFRITISLTSLYIFVDFIKHDLFFPSNIILWITIYFFMAYIKRYLMDFADSVHKNIILLIFSLICFIGSILLIDIAGLHISFLSDKVLYWWNNCNPFILAISLAMFNIARNIHFKNRIINYVSSLSLLIYIIHENIILRTYFRPRIWIYIYSKFGYTYVIGWVFIIAIIISLFGILTAMSYTLFLQKKVGRVSNIIYDFISKRYLVMEENILK